ncbi:hypothetical protein BZL39_I05880 [Zygosaccharomyces parabailii]|nr:hypothetical protein BZL39_C08870 [Zygosaccharomyces parabailii]AQZ15839.1 hypothetical protein BZL39_I05880 [Zygosaccharomyces parabailii]
MSDQKTKDLENCAETYEEEDIQLLEDRRAGKLTYFISWYFFRGKWLWNIILPVGCAIAAFLMWWTYLCLCDIYYYRFDDTKTSDLFPPLWLTVHYFLFFVVFFVDCMEKRKNLILEEKLLQKLLGEVSETDLMGDPVAWRRIAFNVNQCFVRKKYNSSIFYGGEQCRCFFVKEVVIPIDSGSCAIRTCYNDDIYTDFCKNSSNKNLAQKAVANYKKSTENYDELLHMDGEPECDSGLFKKIHTVSVISTLSLVAIELALSMTMSLAMVTLVLYRIIFN